MIIKQNSDITFKWFDAFNEHNIEKLLALYHDDAEHCSPKLMVRHPETKGFIKGKDALRNWWSDAFERLPSLHYNIVSLMIMEESVNMTYKRTVDSEPDMEVMEMLIIKQGLIVSSSVLSS